MLGVIGGLGVGLAGCLDRPIAPAQPRTSNTLTDQARASTVDKIDVLFMIDNSASMADKQKILAIAVPDLINRLVVPVCVAPGQGEATVTVDRVGGQCPAGSSPEFNPIEDIHIGVVTSSLGSHGSDVCVGQPGSPLDDQGHLLRRGKDEAEAATTPATYQDKGFLAWDPSGKKNTPAGESNEDTLVSLFKEIVRGADQTGCGFESQLEGWYRFLIDPTPPKTVSPSGSMDPLSPAVVDGVDDVLLQQRADFLRPDSLVSVIMLTDENDCSFIDGTLPADVCDDPILDDQGKPQGCRTDRVGWPGDYGVEGNLQGFTRDPTSNRVTGTPFPANATVAQRHQKGGAGDYHLPSGTAACATDPLSPDCKSCLLDPTLPGCKLLSAEDDDVTLRCWDQRRRFGVDALYPLGRYVHGLTDTKVYDRDGYLVTNPLFDDLPYRAAQAAGQTLSREKATPRDARLVFFAGIVGVPWQDIARDPSDLTKGYLPGVPTDTDSKAIDWEYLAGDPSKRDPLMLETNQTRSGQNILGEAVGATGWNSINGHEWVPGNIDLQYACVFNLPSPAMGTTECMNSAARNPLCETPVAGDPGGKGDGTPTTTQFRAKAYPGLRYLPVLQQVKENGILASICTPNVTDSSRDDYGYRPAVNAIIDRLKTQLTVRCLPRQLAANPDGSTPCIIFDARFPKDPAHPPDASTQAEIAECKKCSAKARKKVDPEVARSLSPSVLGYDCLCEVTQVTGPDLAQCTTEAQLTSFTSGNGGWCYVDPDAIDPGAPNAASLRDKASAIVKKCHDNEKRTIRFIDADTQNTTLFITCLGAAAGTSEESGATSPGAAGASGASGASGAAGQ
jgi:hypothetical protein